MISGSPSVDHSSRLIRTTALAIGLLWIGTVDLFAQQGVFGFIHSGDSQYKALDQPAPTSLIPDQEASIPRYVDVLNNFAGIAIPESLGGGFVTSELEGIIVAGDLVASGDQLFPNSLAMATHEWARFREVFGLDGTDGLIKIPAFETWGNHDALNGDTFIIEDLILRNLQRPGTTNLSANEMHYSWDWGGVHFVNLGIFAGDTDGPRPGAKYGPKNSIQFLRDDLAEHVGDSGRPVLIGLHLDLETFEANWPTIDRTEFYNVLSDYQVAGIAHGHKHKDAVRLEWDGTNIGPDLAGAPGIISVFNPDDLSAPSTTPFRGFMYMEIHNLAGVDEDKLVVRSIVTGDNWLTWQWGSMWTVDLDIPDQPIPLSLKVSLDGAFATDAMRADLEGLIPLDHPYPDVPARSVTPEFLAAHPEIVDWVWIEVRSGLDAASSVRRTAVFLTESGDLLDPDGGQEVMLEEFPAGDYYVVVGHRNHLSVIAGPVSF